MFWRSSPSIATLRKDRLVAMGILTWLLGTASPAGADGFKSESALREAVIEAMKSAPGISDVRPSGENDTSITSRIGELEVVTDVGNLFDYLRTYPDEHAAEWIDNLVKSAIESNAYEVNAARLVPMVRTARDIANLAIEAPHENIVGDLVLAYAFDLPNGYAYANGDQLESLKLPSVREAALGNLEAKLSRLSAADDGGPVVLYSIDEYFGLSPALILLDAFWERVSKRFPGGAIFINPRRDQIFLIDKRNPEAMMYARALIDATAKDDFALQSRGIFERAGDALVVLAYH